MLVGVLALALAVAACTGGGGKGTTGSREQEQQRQAQQMLAFARCMRQHGIDMPDPTPDGSLPDSGSLRLNPDDPRFKAAERACPGFRPKY